MADMDPHEHVPQRLPRPDAYVTWSLLTRFRDVGGFEEGGWLSVLIELRPGTSAQRFAEFTQDVSALHESIRVPLHYAAPPTGLGDTSFCTAAVREAFLKAMLGSVPAPSAQAAWAIEQVERFEIGFASKPAPPRRIQEREHAVGAARILVGVIDDGLAFANQRFLTAAGTPRMVGLWNQDADAPAAATAWGYGEVHTAAQLAGYVRDSLHHGRLDEEEVYRRARYDGLRHRVTHGTHVMDLACGADPADVDAGMAAIVGVQLPAKQIEDTSCGSLAVHMLDGLRYVLACADELAVARCPVIVNLSYGSIAGPHDGSSIFEAAVEQIIRLRRRRAPLHVVMPAGNSYLSRCHAWCDLEAELPLDWRILPDDGTPSFLEIWLPAAADVVVAVRAPDGAAIEGVPLGQSRTLADARGPLCTVVHRDDVANGRGVMVLVTIAPTAPGAGATVAPCGTWKVTVRNRGRPQLLNAWIQRDDVAFGRKGRGRQSYFSEAAYRRYKASGLLELQDDSLAYTRRQGTLNGMATAPRTEVVGGYRLSDGEPARYSATSLPVAVGPAALRPIFLAATEDSAVCHGVLAAGTRSGSVAALSGTSMAVPQLVRLLADRLANGTLSQPLADLGVVADHLGVERFAVPLADDVGARSRRRRAP